MSNENEIGFELPPQLRQMFFNNYLMQMEEGKKLAHKTREPEKWGKPLSVFFIFTPEKNIQRYKFENHESDSEFSNEQRDGLLSPFGFNISEMWNNYRMIIAECKFSTMEIYLQIICKDGTKKPLITI